MIISGTEYSKTLRESLKKKITILKETHSIQPGLAVLLVGYDPASQIYVRNKIKQTQSVGMKSIEYQLPNDTSETSLLQKINNLNNDKTIHGILIQLPLPSHINEEKVLNSVAMNKDVDGFHCNNMGRLLTHSSHQIVPCTPLGALKLLKTYYSSLEGLHALVIGRSAIVGKPMSLLLLQENCTVTIAHSKTKHLKALCLQADIVVAAIGQPQMIKGDWIKAGAFVLDVGINRIIENGKIKLVGDVEFLSAVKVAGAITPVPGGVGPMTIACLLENTFQQCCRAHQIEICP
jgi:methylenetetrahydrofolate dehydrogenase (NADP+)/methenyltetrahydrofolate cyclohydrolase